MFDAAMDVAPSVSTLGSLNDAEVTYTLVEGAESLAALVADLTAAGRFAFDTETSGLNAMEAQLVGMSFSAIAGTGSYVPVNPSTWSDIQAIVKPLLENPALTVVGQNLKFDGKVMAQHGVDLTLANLEDTMVAHYLLEPDQPHGIDALAQAFLVPMHPHHRLVGQEGEEQKSMADIPPAEVVNYACEDADITLQLAEVLLPKLEEEGLMTLYRDVEMPLLSVLLNMNSKGSHSTRPTCPSSATPWPPNWTSSNSPSKATPAPFNVDSPKQPGMCCLSIWPFLPKSRRPKPVNTPPAKPSSAN